RSRIKASAPDCGPLESLRSLSAGMKSRERISPFRRAAFHQSGAPADRYGLAALVDALVFELDHAGILARLAAPLCPDDWPRAQRFAVKYRFGKANVAHPQVGDRSPEGRFTDAHADHQTEGE